MLFNEPKLLKSGIELPAEVQSARFSALQRAEIAEINSRMRHILLLRRVSVLFNEPKLLKLSYSHHTLPKRAVSVLFNEPKLLKLTNEATISEFDAEFQCSSTSRNC